MYRLRFYGGEHNGETYPIDRTHGTIIGRSPTNTVYVRDKNVSRVHCQIIVGDQGCVITDLQSTNGTFVNDERITEKVLKSGDEVRIGITTFRVEEIPEEPESTTETSPLP